MMHDNFMKWRWCHYKYGHFGEEKGYASVSNNGVQSMSKVVKNTEIEELQIF